MRGLPAFAFAGVRGSGGPPLHGIVWYDLEAKLKTYALTSISIIIGVFENRGKIVFLENRFFGKPFFGQSFFWKAICLENRVFWKTVFWKTVLEPELFGTEPFEPSRTGPKFGSPFMVNRSLASRLWST